MGTGNGCTMPDDCYDFLKLKEILLLLNILSISKTHLSFKVISRRLMAYHFAPTEIKVVT